MTYQTTSHQVSHTFEVEIECDEGEEERHYQAWCRGLTGCQVYASTQAKALRKIRQSIAMWLELANRQMEGQDNTIADMIDMMVPD